MPVVGSPDLSRRLYLFELHRPGRGMAVPASKKIFCPNLKQAKKQKTGSAQDTPWTGPVSLDVLHCTGAPRLRMSYSVCVFFSR